MAGEQSAGALTAAANGRAERPVRILQLTDTHLSRSHPFFVRNWEAALADARGADADLVLVTGDLSVDGAGSDDDLVFAASEMKRLGALVLPGNHDIGECQRDHDQPVDAGRLARWRDIIGDDRFVADLPHWRLVGLNSQIMGSGLEEEREQRAFTEAVFAEADGRHLALFLHKPLFMEGPEEEDMPVHAIPGEARRWLLGAIARHGIRLVSCGHVHQYSVQRRDGALYAWAPATSFVTGQLYGDGQPLLGSIEWHLGADGKVSHALRRPHATAHLELETIRGEHANLRSMPPQAIADTMARIEAAGTQAARS